jgi:nickel/cobalt transporter (NicO) family protein
VGAGGKEGARVKRLTPFLAALALVAPGAALAHPLGNFTVNRHTEITASGDRIYVHYALDLAEIPTFQEGKRLRSTGAARLLARGLVLEVDRGRRPLRPLTSILAARPGAGGLETLRVDVVYDAGPAGGTLQFEDRNYARRLGWKEVVLRAERGARIATSTAPEQSSSDALRNYPKDLLQQPPDRTSAAADIRPGTLSGEPPALESAPAAERAGNGFESLIERQELGPGLILVSLVLALFWGAAHALTPGHGKAIVAAYLVGSRGKARHAVALGGIVTVTHTIGVFALGIVTLALSELVVPEDLYPWLNLVAALLVVGVGVTVLRHRILGWAHARDGHHHGHGHGHHHHGHGDARGLLAVGISGGLLPCPTALVVLLAAISLHRVAFGLLLIVAFSLGLAAVITGIGLLAVSARRAFSRLSLEGPLVRALPAFSACAIVALGLVMTFRTLPTIT